MSKFCHYSVFLSFILTSFLPLVGNVPYHWPLLFNQYFSFSWFISLFPFLRLFSLFSIFSFIYFLLLYFPFLCLFLSLHSPFFAHFLSFFFLVYILSFFLYPFLSLFFNLCLSPSQNNILIYFFPFFPSSITSCYCSVYVVHLSINKWTTNDVGSVKQHQNEKSECHSFKSRWENYHFITQSTTVCLCHSLNSTNSSFHEGVTYQHSSAWSKNIYYMTRAKCLSLNKSPKAITNSWSRWG